MTTQGTAGDERLPASELISPRRCDTCIWLVPHPMDGLLECREGPTPVTVSPAHWCGRWREREDRLGGLDVRKECPAIVKAKIGEVG